MISDATNRGNVVANPVRMAGLDSPRMAANTSRSRLFTKSGYIREKISDGWTDAEEIARVCGADVSLVRRIMRQETKRKQRDTLEQEVAELREQIHGLQVALLDHIAESRRMSRRSRLPGIPVGSDRQTSQ